ncbi:hypothetical protein DFH08DRAFT_976028 [Mycena albidolilacea]|uniref:Uncharacterized protein n=1 Tax=Mycena albidolilacea TaxID=1033008 RepID=A0AAD6Z3D6_9AGAR|nr:hypothetical protein DFH08DRAFT_976028 [Mycena albidolilacea]
MDHNRPAEFLRRLVPPSPRLLVPLLFTNIIPEVFGSPSILTKIPRPAPDPASDPDAAAPTSGVAAAPASGAAAPTSGTAPGIAAPTAVAPALGTAIPAPSAATPAPSAATPAPSAAPPAPSATTPASVPPVRSHPHRTRRRSRACSARHDTSMTGIEDDEPTTPPQPRPRRWSLSGDGRIPSPKAPTKKDVVAFLKELYQLRTLFDAQEKYEEFRRSVDKAAKATLIPTHTLTKQPPAKLNALRTELCKVYPWFARTENDWPARPYLLDRQRNLSKRDTNKKNQLAHREVEKVFRGRRQGSGSFYKAATPIGLRKTRSVVQSDL